MTLLAAFITTVQVVLEPAQLPPHPENRPSWCGVAVSTTEVLWGTVAEQTLAPWPQLMPTDAVTLPRALSPPMVTVSSRGSNVNVAVALRARSMVSVQFGPVPAQSPDQPLKVPFAPQTAVRVTVES